MSARRRRRKRPPPSMTRAELDQITMEQIENQALGILYSRFDDFDTGAGERLSGDFFAFSDDDRHLIPDPAHAVGMQLG